jgi:hypothetical protein
MMVSQDVTFFLLNMEEKVVEDQRISVLDIALHDTPARWWANQKSLLKNWDDVNQVIKYRFQDKEMPRIRDADGYPSCTTVQ